MVILFLLFTRKFREQILNRMPGKLKDKLVSGENKVGKFVAVLFFGSPGPGGSLGARSYNTPYGRSGHPYGVMQNYHDLDEAEELDWRQRVNVPL